MRSEVESRASPVGILKNNRWRDPFYTAVPIHVGSRDTVMQAKLTAQRYASLHNIHIYIYITAVHASLLLRHLLQVPYPLSIISYRLSITI